MAVGQAARARAKMAKREDFAQVAGMVGRQGLQVGRIRLRKVQKTSAASTAADTDTELVLALRSLSQLPRGHASTAAYRVTSPAIAGMRRRHSQSMGGERQLLHRKPHLQHHGIPPPALGIYVSQTKLKLSNC